MCGGGEGGKRWGGRVAASVQLSLWMGLFTIDPGILGGVPCFPGTRVPVASLFEHIKGGYTVDGFLAQFPTVTRLQALAVLNAAEQALLAGWD